MNREEKIREEIEKTLNASDKIDELEANPFLFTRLKSEIERLENTENKSSAISNGILKPVALLFFVLLNIFSSFYIVNSNSQTTVTKQTYLSAISSEYNLNQTYNSQLNKLIGE